MKFEVGDLVEMPGVPFTVEVLEVTPCIDLAPLCPRESFRFRDPVSGEDDWMHCDEFRRVT